MGTISKLLGAGIKKMDIKKYQEGITKRATETHAKQIKELNEELGKTKDKEIRSKLRLQIEHLKKRQLPKGLGGKTMATKKGKSDKTQSKQITSKKAPKMQSTDFKKKGLSKKQASKSTTKKLLKSQSKRRKEAEPTAEELLDQMKEMDTFKRQAD